MSLDDSQCHLPALEEAIDRLPLTVPPDMSLVEVLARMSRAKGNYCDLTNSSSLQPSWHSSPKLCKRYSCALVVEDSQLVGLFTERDLVRLTAAQKNLTQLMVAEVMTRKVITLKSAQQSIWDIHVAISLMHQHQIRHLPVVGDRGQLHGIVTPDSLRNVLQPSSLLRLRAVKEAMNSQVVCATLAASVLSISQLMTEHRISCVVIIAQEATLPHPRQLETENCPVPLGIITERDIVQFQLLELNMSEVRAEQVMSGPLVCVSPEDSLWHAHQEMQRLRVRRLVVTGQEGELQGIITQTSALKTLDPLAIYTSVEMLEQTVDERTRQLQQANQELQREILERQRAEGILRESEEVMRLFVEHVPAAVAMLDRQLYYLAVSRRWVKDYKLEGQNLIGRSLHEVLATLSEGCRAVHELCLNGAVKTGENEQFIQADGTVEWLRWEVRPWYDVAGEIGGLIVFTELLTERKLLAEKLRQEQELAQVTLKSIGDAVITTDAKGNVKELNPTAEQLTGWPSEEAQGRSLSEIFQIVEEESREPLENPVVRVLQEGQTLTFTNRTVLLARDGTEYAIDNSVAPIRDRDGETVGTVLVFRDITASRQLVRQLSWRAMHDSLTGLFNRREFEQQLLELLSARQQSDRPHVLCYLDLDQFKIVNDTCGHIAGDELLRQITQLLRARVRDTDILARLGGDEFGLLLRQCTLVQAEQMVETLRELIQEFRFTWLGKTFSVGASIGLVAIDDANPNVTDLLSAADSACYAAKERGRNCVHVYHADDRELVRQRSERQWVSRLSHALEEDRFCLYVQHAVPIDPAAGQCHYAEVLVRLIDENGELVPPMAFIPAAERYDLMPAIDRWVVRAFFAACDRLSPSVEKPVLYAINLSGASINNPEFLGFLKDQFERDRALSEIICFEITETAAISNLNRATEFIRDLKKLGCRFALDDFGSGMSSLSYLKTLPIDYLKIDGCFIKNIASDKIDRSMVECLSKIAEVMDIQTIAECVENQAILEELRSLGVDYAQGYGIAKPRPLVL